MTQTLSAQRLAIGSLIGFQRIQAGPFRQRIVLRQIELLVLGTTGDTVSLRRPGVAITGREIPRD